MPATKKKATRRKHAPFLIPPEAAEKLEQQEVIVRHVGRPPAFASPQEFEDKVNEYVTLSKSIAFHLPNKAGLAFFLGIDRGILEDYAIKPGFNHTMKTFMAWVEDVWVQRLGRQQPTGAIFYLKNAFRDHYKDVYVDGPNGGTNIFVLPREIADKHHLELPEAPAPVVPHEPEAETEA